MTPAIILAGSHVWDAQSLESLCPRVLLPIANVPLIAYLLEWLRGAGVEAVTICANDAAGPLQACLQDGTDEGLDLYYYEDRVPRGPAGCIRDAAAMTDADQFVVVDGSIVPGVEIQGLLGLHGESGAAATVAVQETTPGNGANGPELSPVGVYVFARRALEHVPLTGYQDIKEALIPQLTRHGELVVTYLAGQPSPRVNGLESYFAVQAWMLERLCQGETRREDYERHNGACIHPSAQVADSVRLIGAVMVGPETCVKEDSIIIGPSVLGRGCLVGRGSVIGRSVIWDLCSVGEQAMIDQCLVTSGVVVGAGEVRQGSICSGDTGL